MPQLSVHIRGPTNLKQFAVYNLGAAPRKAKRSSLKDEGGHVHARRHAAAHLQHHQRHQHHQHQDVHARGAEPEPVFESESEMAGGVGEKEKREVWVTATIDGQVVSWINNYFGPTPAPEAPAPPAPAPAPAAPTPEVVAPPPSPANEAPAASPGEGAQPGQEPDKPHKSHKAPQRPKRGDYGRIGYYHADAQIAEGVTFLGNYGGQGSGKFD